MLVSLLAISLGASAGAISRWLLGIALNGLFPAMPPGTLAANLIGGYLIGLALGVFAQHPGVAPEWRLLVMTGFLGGLTTFSTFSLEVVSMLQHGRWLLAATTAGLHVFGSLLLTWAGMRSAAAWLVSA